MLDIGDMHYNLLQRATPWKERGFLNRKSPSLRLNNQETRVAAATSKILQQPLLAASPSFYNMRACQNPKKYSSTYPLSQYRASSSSALCLMDKLPSKMCYRWDQDWPIQMNFPFSHLGVFNIISQIYPLSHWACIYSQLRSLLNLLPIIYSWIN